MSKYESMKVDELRKLASKAGIKNSRRFKKVELVEELERVGELKKREETIQENTSAKKHNRSNFVASAELGTIVAFTWLGKTRSAKIKEKDEQSKILTLETKYGAVYHIPYGAVIWVKTGSRFPRGVYNLLKGIKNE